MSRTRIIIFTAGIALLTVISGVGAYYTGADSAVNTFTSGEIKLELTEASWDAALSRDIEPGATIPKDPCVNNNGNNSAFVFLKVDIPKRRIYTYDSNTKARLPLQTIQLFELCGLDHAWSLIESDTSKEDRNSYVYVYGSQSHCTELMHGESTVSLFTSVQYCNAVEGQELDRSHLSIDISLYGIQADNITGADTDSASEVWSILKNQTGR